MRFLIHLSLSEISLKNVNIEQKFSLLCISYVKKLRHISIRRRKLNNFRSLLNVQFSDMGQLLKLTDHNGKSLPRARPSVPRLAKRRIHRKKSSRWRTDAIRRDESRNLAVVEDGQLVSLEVSRKVVVAEGGGLINSGKGGGMRGRTEDTFTLTGVWPTGEREARCSSE